MAMPADVYGRESTRKDIERGSALDSRTEVGTPRLSKEVVAPALPEGLELAAVKGTDLLLLTFTKASLHAEDPLCLSSRWKAWITLLCALLVMNTALSSSAPSGAAPFIQAQFGGNSALPLSLYLIGYVAGPFVGAPLSEAYGRRPLFVWGGLIFTLFTGACAAANSLTALLVLRFFAGFFGSVPTTNSGAAMGDIWTPKKRGTAMAWYSVATFSGPALGPVIGSFAAVRINWRWCFIILTIISAAISMGILFACPETYAPVILSRIARRLRVETGDNRIVSQLELEERAIRGTPRLHRLKAETSRLLGTPVKMLFTESIVICITAFMSVVYGLIYLLFEAYPVIFSEVHKISPGYSSLPFLATLVGAMLSVPIQLFYQRIVPTLSGVLQGLAGVLIFRALQTHLIDCYETYAASAIAANVTCRSICGAVFPLFAHSLYVRLGVNYASTLLAGIMLLLVPIPFVFERYGERIRKNSRYAPVH